MKKKTQSEGLDTKLESLVFGLDENGKPKAARFTSDQAELAAQAASSLKLEVHTAGTADLKALAGQLPLGRIYAKGKAFVPFIKRELYDKVCAACSSAGADESAQPSDRETSKSTETEAQTVVVGLPRYWDSIGPGHLVLVYDGPGEGWWESVVVARNDQMLTLRYRDYPKQKQFDRHLSTVALINPGPQ